MTRARIFAGLCIACLLASCAPRPPGLGSPVGWAQLDGWEEDRQAEAWPALLRSCDALARRAKWREICAAARALPPPDDAAARKFFERWFRPHPLRGKGGAKRGLITGYYEPLLFGSFTRDARYRHPLYAQPESLLTLELGALHSQLAGNKFRGRLAGGRVVPFYTRAEIDAQPSPLAGGELIWLDDRDAVFFLHIQGSGRIQLPDGRVIAAAYRNHNGHPYRSIGRILVERGELTREEASLFGIRRWLRENPQRAQELLFLNPRYVFFALRDEKNPGARGALNVPLSAQRSIAIDPAVVELGAPVWLTTNYPGAPRRPYRRLVMAQDTGGAITGALRADLFWGHGARAERAAGVMREQGGLTVLLPINSGESQE
ncbi:MAG: murein transglycosylase A [Gammaproteobacteria bacterium]|nr:murein transglycosylase A [Gammaproteobacteria bacterium]